MVVQFKYGIFSAVLTGDATAETQNSMRGRGLARDRMMLVAPHHGAESEGSNDDAWAVHTRPEVVVYSTGLHRGQGFLLISPSGSGFLFRDNEVIGNRGAGIWLQAGPELRLQGNVIYGNLGEATAAAFPAVPNCGLVNETGATIDATRNYWGAPTGPGPDPADDAGPRSICDRNGTTLVVPFDSTESLRREG